MLKILRKWNVKVEDNVTKIIDEIRSTLENEYENVKMLFEKSRIRETKHLSTDADSSTDTTVGWTKNSWKPNFFEKR